MSLLDIKAVKAQAAEELAKEKAERAKKALIAKLRQRDTAQDVVRNIDREIVDLERASSLARFA
jgi:hypothetical protein